MKNQQSIKHERFVSKCMRERGKTRMCKWDLFYFCSVRTQELPPLVVWWFALVQSLCSPCLGLFIIGAVSRMALWPGEQGFARCLLQTHSVCVLCPHRRMYAHEVSAAPVQAGVVLELRL